MYSDSRSLKENVSVSLLGVATRPYSGWRRVEPCSELIGCREIKLSLWLELSGRIGFELLACRYLDDREGSGTEFSSCDRLGGVCSLVGGVDVSEGPEDPAVEGLPSRSFLTVPFLRTGAPSGHVHLRHGILVMGYERQSSRTSLEPCVQRMQLGFVSSHYIFKKKTPQLRSLQECDSK